MVIAPGPGHGLEVSLGWRDFTLRSCPAALGKGIAESRRKEESLGEPASTAGGGDITTVTAEPAFPLNRLRCLRGVI